MPDLNQLIIPALLALLAVFCLRELWRGWTQGKMQQYVRSHHRSRNSRPLRRDSAPLSFWGLFAFFVIVVIVACLMIGVAIRQTPTP